MTTNVLFVTDMSGSMRHLAGDVRGGFNTYLDQLATNPALGEIRVTAVLFDNEYEILCNNALLPAVPRLTESNYQPRGSTALLDAVGRTITDFENRVPELGEDDRVMLVIQTDGLENASHRYTFPQIAGMITERTPTVGAKWAVLYIGQGIDSWDQARAMGVRYDTYIATTSDSAGTTRSYEGLRDATVAYTMGATAADTAKLVAQAVSDPDAAAQ